MKLSKNKFNGIAPEAAVKCSLRGFFYAFMRVKAIDDEFAGIINIKFILRHILLYIIYIYLSRINATKTILNFIYFSHFA